MIELSRKIIELIENARNYVAKSSNLAMVFAYFNVGKMLVEEMQDGNPKAEYGTRLLNKVSNDLVQRLGKGYSVDNLENMRRVYIAYKEQFIISENGSRILTNRLNSENGSRKLPSDFLTWSHYLFLSRMANVEERRFYEIESLAGNWGIKELKRQFNSGLYERLALSRNTEKVKELASKGQIVETPTDMLKEPYILEFLGWEEKHEYSETDLETAIINQIEKFMLELGKGFFYGGRQVRFSFDEEHFRVDLVFYNRLLKCFVLFDLKIGKLTHQDLGQMQMYVNYYDRFEKTETENPTIGIILCKNKNDAMVEITLPKDNNQIYAAKYQTILPSKEALKSILNSYE